MQQTFPLSLSDQLLVQPGDTLGLSYPNGTQTPVVGYSAQTPGEDPCCGLAEDDLHVVRLAPTTREQLTGGVEQLGAGEVQRWAIGMTAQVSTSKCQLLFGLSLLFLEVVKQLKPDT